MTTTTGRLADLTPFGFTPTETSAYFALLTRGPSTGYAIAQELAIARANAYQALRGLVTKGAASLVDETPPRFRAVRPDALYAQIVDSATRKLDRLEADLARAPAGGAEPVVRVTGRRAVVDLMSRTAARETGVVKILAPLDVLSAMVPVLRKRVADAAPTTVLVLGAGGQLAVPITDAVPSARLRQFFPTDVVLLTTGTGALAARVEGTELEGFWSSDPVMTGLARATIDTLSSGGGDS